MNESYKLTKSELIGIVNRAVAAIEQKEKASAFSKINEYYNYATGIIHPSNRFVSASSVAGAIYEYMLNLKHRAETDYVVEWSVDELSRILLWMYDIEVING